MDSAQCPQRDTIGNWAQGNLDDESAEFVADHLDDCPACEQVLAEIEAGGLFQGVDVASADSAYAQEFACQKFVGDLQNQAIGRETAEEATDYFDSATAVRRATQADTYSGETTAITPKNELTLPCLFGDYELLNELGKGGMGVVYQARQVTADRMVALKLIRPDQLSQFLPEERQQLLTRFRNEVQAAAKLEHDHVVTVYDVGETDGQLYYAMRLVEGDSLRQKLDDGPLEPQAAARYTGQVTQALAEAHGVGILHRDIKPHNVMVDAKTDRALLADFGLAKLTDGDQQLTVTEAVLGSPPYMSPEQTVDSGKVTTASDIYSLGATLYHLLTGRPPFQAASSVSTMMQVQTSDPVSPRDLNPSIPRDLETICLKCLEKDPTKRYDSAQILGDRLQRVQRGESIPERPVSATEKTWRWCKRNPVVAGLATAVTLMLILGIVVSSSLASWAFGEAERADYQAGVATAANRDLETALQDVRTERDNAMTQTALAEARQHEAEQQTQTAQAVSQFMTGLFEDADPIARTGRLFGSQNRAEGELTALEVVNRGTSQLETALIDNPRVRASLLDQIGNVYLNLDRPQEAEPLLQEALELRLKELGSDHLEVAASWQSLGLLHMSRADLEDASDAFEKALTLRRKLLDEDDPLIADTLFHLGTQRTFYCKYGEAESILQECLAIRRVHADADSRGVVASLLMLGQMHIANEAPLLAAPHLSEAAALVDKREGNNDFSDIFNLFMQAQLAGTIGNADRARALFEKADAKGVQLLGEDHHILAFSRYKYADFLQGQGDNEAAANIMREVADSFRKSFGPDSYYVASLLLQLARAERDMGRKADAEATAREAVDIFRKVLAQRSIKHRNERASECLHVLAALVHNRGQIDEADLYYREAIAIRLRMSNEWDVRTSWIGSQLAHLLLTRKSMPVTRRFKDHHELSGNPDIDFEWAEYWAQAAQILKEDSQSLTDDDELILEYFQQRAVQTLHSAMEHGALDAEELEANANFTILRGRPDFQELLDALDQ